MERTNTYLIKGKIWCVLIISNFELSIHKYLDKNMYLDIIFIHSESMENNKWAEFVYLFLWISLLLIKR